MMAGMVDGKTALVTGGATGIGHAAALLFAHEGARVFVADIDERGAEKTADAIRAAGGEAAHRRVDVANETDVAAMIAEASEVLGRLDCAFNNAGITGAPAPVHATDAADWARTLDVNLGGVFFCMKHELPIMHAQGGGAIVNTASGAGVVATPGLSAYCASKHAILGLTKTAAVENARTGVRINAVCPGSTDTPMLRASMEIDPAVEKMILASVPGGRLGTAQEIAEAAVWLCSDRASFVSGHSMLVDGASVAR